MIYKVLQKLHEIVDHDKIVICIRVIGNIYSTGNSKAIRIMQLELYIVVM